VACPFAFSEFPSPEGQPSSLIDWKHDKIPLKSEKSSFSGILALMAWRRRGFG
jgi:hypothetical protein